LEHSSAFDLADLVAATFRADNVTIGPLDPNHIFVADVQVGEVLDRFDQRFGMGMILAHAPILPNQV